MKSRFALAALIGVSFAAASASGAFAQSAPGTPSTKPNKVTSVPPPPPPPSGPDKFATQTQPPGPHGDKTRDPRGPSIVDDFSAGPGTQASTCHAALGGVKYLNCVASLIAICERRGGTLSGTETSVSCSTN